MANTDWPRGFTFYRDLTSGDCPQVRPFDVTASTTIYRGQLVKIDQTSGRLVACNGTYGNDSGAAGSVVGVAAQYLASQATVYENFPVILAHNAEFIVQDDGGGAVTTRTNFLSTFFNDVYFGITNIAAGSTALGQSTSELAGATSDPTAQYLKVTDWHRVADNEFGDNMDLIVRFNPALFQAGPYPVSVVA